MKLCTVEKCLNKIYAKRLCEKHYVQMRKYGSINRTRYDPNEIIIHNNNVCEMYLYNYKGHYKMSTFFDIEFLNEIKKYKWHCYKDKKNYYVQTIINDIDNKFLKLHQLILPTKKPLVIDHQDRDGLNNRKSNLRRVTNRKNAENNRRNTSGYSGVCWDKSRQKWLSRIVVNKKEIYLGRFGNPLDAYNIRQKFKKDNNLS